MSSCSLLCRGLIVKRWKKIDLVLQVGVLWVV
jgi:hypothetical protein